MEEDWNWVTGLLNWMVWEPSRVFCGPWLSFSCPQLNRRLVGDFLEIQADFGD